MNKLIIPSAGASTRFFELGKHFPKSLLPYRNKPLLLHTIEKYYNYFDEIVVVVNEFKQLYEEIFDFYELNDTKVIPVLQDLIQGPATSVYSGLDGTEDSITIVLSDALYDFEIPDIGLDSVSVMEVDDYSRWCMVDEDINFFDKPNTKPPTNYALSGVYTFSKPNLYFKLSEESIKTTESNETQFSSILQSYNLEQKISLYKHKRSQFIDFGTIEQYIKNKNIPLSRSFNNIEFTNESVIKNSKSNPQKIINEGIWLDNFPISKTDIPKVINLDITNAELEIELISGFTLRELLLYYDNSNNLWDKLLFNLKNFLSECSLYNFETDEFWKKVIFKTAQRCDNTEIEFLEYFENLLNRSKILNESTLFHGDLVFSNIIYEPNREGIKVFDPMGELYGHWGYDLAKIGQCVLGNYDLIDSELYVSEKNFYKLFSTDRKIIQDLFYEIFDNEIEYISKKLLYALIASLYLSMIPLHNHNQKNQKLYYKEFLFFYDLSNKEN